MNVSLALVLLYTGIVEKLGNFMSNEGIAHLGVVLYTSIVETVYNFMSNERIPHLGCAIHMYCKNHE